MTPQLDPDTIDALRNTGGTIMYILEKHLHGRATLNALMGIIPVTERTMRGALTKLRAVGLLNCHEGLWIIPQAVDNPVDNTQPAPQPALQSSAELPQSCAKLLQSSAGLPQSSAELPQNTSATYTGARARLSSSSNINKEDKDDNDSQNEKSAAEKSAVYDLLITANVAPRSKMMHELVNAHWVTADYVSAHIAAWQQKGEPTNYLITRLRDGEPAPPPPFIPDQTAHWMDEALDEIAAEHEQPAPPPQPAPPVLPPAREWRGILDELGQQMTAATFNAWLKNTTAHWIGDNLHVLVRNDYALDWLQHRLLDTITRTAIYHAPRTKSVIIQVDSEFWAQQTVEAPHE